MTRYFLHLGIAASLLLAQSFEPRRLEGIVLDGNGDPVAESAIFYSYHRDLGHTGKDGKFSIQTTYSRLLIRKAGYVSAMATRSNTGDPIIVHLQALPNGKRLPKCPRNNVGFSIRFAKLKGMIVSGESRDVDFTARQYSFGKTASITHGSGPMWAFGMPLQAEVESEGFAEKVFSHPSADTEIYDYRGRDANGSYFRSVGFIGEAAAYSTKDLVAARQLDAILDTACSANAQ